MDKIARLSGEKTGMRLTDEAKIWQNKTTKTVHRVSDRCVPEIKFFDNVSSAWWVPWPMRPLDNASPYTINYWGGVWRYILLG